jgi:hypothetical protein
MADTREEKKKPVATIYRVQFEGTCEDCGTSGVTVIEADIGESSWTFVCLGCLTERLHEMQERLGIDGLYHRFGEGEPASS